MLSKNFMLRIACKCKCVALTLSREPWFLVVLSQPVSALSQGQFFTLALNDFR